MTFDVEGCNVKGQVGHLDGTHCLRIVVGCELVWLQVAVQTFDLCKHTVEFSAGSPPVECCLEFLLGLHCLHLPDTLHFALPLLPCIRNVGVL